MRSRISVLVLLVLLSTGICADDKSGSDPETLESLKKECEAADQKWNDDYYKEYEIKRKAFKKAMEEARTVEEGIEAKKLGVFPPLDPFSLLPEHAARFLAWAKKHPHDPEAFDALVIALQYSRGTKRKGADTWVATLQVLKENYAANPKIKTLLPELANYHEAASTQLLRAVVEQYPDRRTKALALRAITQGKSWAIQDLQRLKKADRQAKEQELGKAEVAKQLASLDRLQAEVAELRKEFQTNYGDLFPDLSIGKPVPELMSQDLKGNKVKLSDLKGKVMVIDIWTTHCGACHLMNPHLREMTARLKEKPFVLVSISTDEDVTTVTKFLDKEKMPWTHWWNGRKGGIIDDWEVTYYPTIYVIDTKGVIRFKDLRGKALEEAVDKLLKETEHMGEGEGEGEGEGKTRP